MKQTNKPKFHRKLGGRVQSTRTLFCYLLQKKKLVVAVFSVTSPLYLQSINLDSQVSLCRRYHRVPYLIFFLFVCLVF